MEFGSFAATALAAAKHAPLAVARSGRGRTPWVPNGQGKEHSHTTGTPSRAEREAAHEAALRAAARSAATVGHGLLHAQCDQAEATMSRLEDSLGGLAAEFEQHAIGAAAANALITKRLSQLAAL